MSWFNNLNNEEQRKKRIKSNRKRISIYLKKRKEYRFFIAEILMENSFIINRISPIDLMSHDFTPGDVSKITKRDPSSIRYARLRGKIKGLKAKNGLYMYSMYDMINGFGRTKNHKKWTEKEIEELKKTGKCNTRTKASCKTMLWRIKIDERGQG